MQLKNIVDNMILFEEKYFADFGILVCVISVWDNVPPLNLMLSGRNIWDIKEISVLYVFCNSFHLISLTFLL